MHNPLNNRLRRTLQSVSEPVEPKPAHFPGWPDPTFLLGVAVQRIEGGDIPLFSDAIETVCGSFTVGDSYSNGGGPVTAGGH